MWSVVFLIPALLLMLLAAFQTWSFFEYRKRQRKKGRKKAESLSQTTWLLYGAACFLLFLSLVTFVSGNRQALPPTQDTLHTPSATTETIPEETIPEETVEPWATLPADRTLTAKYYFVYDCNTKTFLQTSGDINEKVYPASITKLFSIYVARQHLEDEQLVTVGDAVKLVSSGSSLAKIKKGNQLTVAQLVEGMMLPSGNDAAYVLAAEAGRILEGADATDKEAVAAFVEEMNLQASALGMENTQFANPDGYHNANHYSSMKDLATIGMLALKDPVLMQYASTTAETIALSNNTLTWQNTNELIQPESEFYCPYAIGLKTGRTKAAGNCLLSAFSYKKTTYIVGVFGCAKTEDRFADALQLFNETIGYEG